MSGDVSLTNGIASSVNGIGSGEIGDRLADPLAACRVREDGVGFVGPDVPIEVLIASGRPFGHLPWRADGATPWADRWLESSFPYWSRSILEQWHDGDFDALETVVFSRADDASQRLYYYVAELRRRGELGGPVPRIFDIALIQRESSLAHTEAAILELMGALDVTVDRLREGVERANRLRRRFAEIERSRAADGPLHERLARAALWTDPCAWIDDFPMPMPMPMPMPNPMPMPVPMPSAAAVRLLLAGSMPPDERLHEAAEAAGASIVAEAHALALGRVGPEVRIEQDPPARALAKHLRSASIAPRAFFDRGAWIVERARAAQAAGVVIWLTREDEALAWTAPSQQRALAAAGLPVLLLAARRWQADDDTFERFAEFVGRCARASA
jgi:hypothetical protein